MDFPERLSPEEFALLERHRVRAEAARTAINQLQQQLAQEQAKLIAFEAVALDLYEAYGLVPGRDAIAPDGTLRRAARNGQSAGGAMNAELATLLDP